LTPFPSSRDRPASEPFAVCRFLGTFGDILTARLPHKYSRALFLVPFGERWSPPGPSMTLPLNRYSASNSPTVLPSILRPRATEPRGDPLLTFGILSAPEIGPSPENTHPPLLHSVLSIPTIYIPQPFFKPTRPSSFHPPFDTILPSLPPPSPLVNRQVGEREREASVGFFVTTSGSTRVSLILPSFPEQKCCHHYSVRFFRGQC